MVYNQRVERAISADGLDFTNIEVRVEEEGQPVTFQHGRVLHNVFNAIGKTETHARAGGKNSTQDLRDREDALAERTVRETNDFGYQGRTLAVTHNGARDRISNQACANAQDIASSSSR